MLYVSIDSKPVSVLLTHSLVFIVSPTQTRGILEVENSTEELPPSDGKHFLDCRLL